MVTLTWFSRSSGKRNLAKYTTFRTQIRLWITFLNSDAYQDELQCHWHYFAHCYHRHVCLCPSTISENCISSLNSSWILVLFVLLDRSRYRAQNLSIFISNFKFYRVEFRVFNENLKKTLLRLQFSIDFGSVCFVWSI